MSFDDRKREIGDAAKNQQLSNIDNTIHNFKKSLMVSKIESLLSNQGQVEFPVTYLNGSEVYDYDCIQVTAMLFAKLKSDANAALKPDTVTECVIAIPAYFTKSEYKSILIAAAVGGLQCNNIIKETTAVAVNYKFSRKIPDTTFVAFVDFGYEFLQVSIWEFSDLKMEAIAETAELTGSRKIDELLADHFIDQIKNPQATKENKSFYHGLLVEVEKLKTKMTVNTEELPLDINHLLNGDSVELSMQRSEMERICQTVFDKIETIMKKCLDDSKLSPEDIHSVEIVGGSSRIPAVKNLIKKVFGKIPSATMNQEEAVSRGCFLKSRMSKNMKDFKIIEIPLQEGEVEEKGFMEISEVSDRSYITLFVPET